MIKAVRWPVEVTHHAKWRCRYRFPTLKLARMSDEVRDALAHNRVSARRPDWLAPPSGLTPVGGLYAWTADHGRTYVIVGHDDCFVVLTVMTPVRGR